MATKSKTTRLKPKANPLFSVKQSEPYRGDNQDLEYVKARQ